MHILCTNCSSRIQDDAIQDSTVMMARCGHIFCDGCAKIAQLACSACEDEVSDCRVLRLAFDSPSVGCDRALGSPDRAAEVTALQRDLAHYRAQLILAARLQKLHESERNHAEWSLECAEGRLDFLHQQCELERERYDELEHLRHNVAREQEDLDTDTVCTLNLASGILAESSFHRLFVVDDFMDRIGTPCNLSVLRQRSFRLYRAKILGHTYVCFHTDSVTDLPEPGPILPYWSAKRHLTCGNPTPPPPWAPKMVPWRAAPGKIKTAHAALVLCLNIDVDPPDIVKTNPCAVLEAWVDPHTMPSHKALEVIGTNLQHQFEGLNPKISYKPILDPSKDDLKRFCVTLRKQAMEDAVLFHYNGHGVPKPTPSGELWCFNRNYTQYIPVALQEIQNWLRSLCIYIWDCSAAGNLLTNFVKFAETRDNEAKMHRGGYPEGMQPFSECIQLAACAAEEQLPSCPALPADLFTSCLTSPIDIALRYFVLTHQLPNDVSSDQVMQLPGDLKDRRTPLGELNWIFTAITDTIAWTTFPREIFTRLYRSDLLIASLFRNFLLAERIMKNHHCTPHTYPPLPSTNTHPLWASWDFAIDACVRQLPELLKNTEPSLHKDVSLGARNRRQASRSDQPGTATPNPAGEKSHAYVPSRFFTDQLTAFEVWISRGGSALTRPGPGSLPVQLNGEQALTDSPLIGSGQAALPDLERRNDHHLVPRKPPEPHRLRALILLSQFVDLGPWVVHLALTIGIFPYIARLLQAAGQDLKPVLIFIWARISAVDPSCQVDLYNNQGYKYFASALSGLDETRQTLFPNGSEHKAMCAFILSTIARDYVHGQNACWRERVFDACFEHLDEGDFLLRQWSALSIAQIWDANDEIKVYGVDRGMQDKLIALLSDDSPEVRSAALYALGTLLGASGSADLTKLGGGGSGTMYQLDERIHFRMEVAVVTGAALAIKEYASPMVRKELLVLIRCLVKEWRGYFIVCAWIYWEEDHRWEDGENAQHADDDVAAVAVSEWLEGFGDNEDYRAENRVLLSSFFTIFSILMELSVDPYQDVDYIMALLLESPFTRLDNTTLGRPPSSGPKSKTITNGKSHHQSSRSSHNHSPFAPQPGRPPMTRSETMTSTISNGVASTLKRTTSFANIIKGFAGNTAFPSSEDGRASPKPTLSVKDRFEVPEVEGVSRPPSPNLNYAQYTSPYSRPESPQDGYSVMDRSTTTTLADHQPTMDFNPTDVLDALMGASASATEGTQARQQANTHQRDGFIRWHGEPCRKYVLRVERHLGTRDERWHP